MWGFGSSGVQFFFVLSGFIIFHAHRRERGQRKRLPIYLKKRFTRVYPPYWIVTLALLPFWLLVPSFGEAYHKSVSALSASLALFPQPHPPHLNVGWTLVHEVLFYLFFSLFFYTQRFFWAVAAWSGLIVGYWAIYGDAGPSWLLDFLFSVNNLLFLLGLLVAQYVLELKGRAGGWLLAGGTLGYAAGAALDFHAFLSGNAFILWFGLSAVLLVSASATGALEQWFGRRRLLLFLGNASYSIYLVHFPLISFGCKILRWFQGHVDLPGPVVWVALLVLSLLGGSIFHVVIEKPAIGLVGSWLELSRSRRGSPPPDAAVPAEKTT